MNATSVYRLYDVDGKLLYVGVSKHPRFRLDQHSSKQPWWPEVDAIETFEYPTRNEAMKAEHVAIRDERPVYNIAAGCPTAGIGASDVADLSGLPEQLRRAQELVDEAKRDRDALIVEARKTAPLREIAKALGVSHTMVAKMEKRADRWPSSSSPTPKEPA